MGILVNYISAEDVIKTRCLRDEDLGMTKFALWASYLPTVYNDLNFEGTKTSTMRKYYINTENNTLAIPNDCLLLIAVGYEDKCGSIKGMWYNNALPKEILFENRQDCGCETCNDGTHDCSNVKEFDKVTETVIILGDSYTKTIKTTILTDGRIIRETTTPTLTDTDEGSGVGETVIFPVTTELICSLDLLECGCVAKSESNTAAIAALETSCCSLSTNDGTYGTKCCTNKDKNTYSLDIQGRLIVLSPNYDKDYIILKFITAVNSAGDYQIPAIALECVLAGLKYYSESNKEKSRLGGYNGQSHLMYKQAMAKLKQRLRPMPYQRIMDAMGVTVYKHRTRGYYYNNIFYPYNNYVY